MNFRYSVVFLLQSITLSCALAQFVIPVQFWEFVDPTLPLHDMRNVNNIKSNLPKNHHSKQHLEKTLLKQHQLLTQLDRPYLYGAKRNMPEVYYRYLHLQIGRSLMTQNGPDFTELMELVKTNHLDGYLKILDQYDHDAVQTAINKYSSKVKAGPPAWFFEILKQKKPTYILTILERFHVPDDLLSGWLGYACPSTIQLLLDRLPFYMKGQETMDDALHDAIAHKNTHALELLIRNGADVNSIVKMRTPLILAVLSNSKESVDILIKHGAHVNEIIETKLSWKQLAWSYTFKLIIEACPLDPDWIHKNPLMKTSFLQGLYDWIVASGNVDVIATHEPPLMIAVRYNYEPIVKQLIQAGADLNIKARYQTPLSLAVIYEHENLVKFLLRSDADVEKSMNACNWGWYAYRRRPAIWKQVAKVYVRQYEQQKQEESA